MRSAQSETAPQKPQDINVPFDVSSSQASIVADVKITERRPYQFYLNVYYMGTPDLNRVYKLVGDGSRYPDGRYGHPGVVVPLQVTVTDDSGAVIYDGVRNVQGVNIHGFGRFGEGYFSRVLGIHGDDGYLSRYIGGLELKPGTYRVIVKTIKETPEFSGTQCSFSVQWHPNTGPLSN